MADSQHSEASKQPAPERVERAAELADDESPALLQRAVAPSFQGGRINPRALTPRAVLALQRTIGNQAVGRLLGQANERQAEPIQRAATAGASGVVVQRTPPDPNQSVDPDADPNQSVDPDTGPNQSVDPDAGPNQSVDPDSGPNQSVDPDAGPNQSVDPNAGPNQSVDPDAGPNQSVDPDAGPNQSVDPNAGPNQSVEPDTGPNQSVDPNAGPNQSVDPNAGPNQSVDPDAGPNQSIDPNAGPNQSIDPDAGPNQSVDPDAGPNQSIDPNAGPNQSVDPDAGPNQSVDPDAGPNQSVDPDAEPNQSIDPDAGPNQSVDPNAGPNQSVDPDAGPNQSIDPDAGPNQTPNPNPSPDDPVPTEEYVVPFDHNPVSAPGERILFNDQFTHPAPNTYQLKYTGVGGTFDSATGSAAKTIAGLNSGNNSFFIDAAWDGQSSVTVTLEVQRIADSQVVRSYSWTFTKKTTLPTTMQQQEAEGEVNLPGVYSYVIGPRLHPDAGAGPDYEHLTILETFGQRTCNITLDELKPAFKTANPGITTPEQITAHFFGTSSNNGTFTVDHDDKIYDQHGGGIPDLADFTDALTTMKEVTCDLPQTYEINTGVALGHYTIRRIMKVDGSKMVKKMHT